jgi:hypothetical protein
MNNTNEELFQDCFVFNSKYQVLTKVHSKDVFNGMISSCTFVTILIIPTILLNGVSACSHNNEVSSAERKDRLFPYNGPVNC